DPKIGSVTVPTARNRSEDRRGPVAPILSPKFDRAPSIPSAKIPRKGRRLRALVPLLLFFPELTAPPRTNLARPRATRGFDGRARRRSDSGDPARRPRQKGA